MEQEGGNLRSAPRRVQERAWVPPAATQPRLLLRASRELPPLGVGAVWLVALLLPDPSLLLGSPAAVPRYLRGRCARQPRPARPPWQPPASRKEQRERAPGGGQGRAGTRGEGGTGPRYPRGVPAEKGTRVALDHWELRPAMASARRAVATCLYVCLPTYLPALPACSACLPCPALPGRGWQPSRARLPWTGNFLL